MSEKAEHILSLSYGKDSLACLGAIEELGWPLDRIVHAEIWATKTIPADLPPMMEFKARADEIIKARWGIEVEPLSTKKAEGISGERVSFEECFYRKMTSGKFVGRIKGFPMQRGNWCTKLKLNAIKQIGITKDTVQYIGIAADEPERFHDLNERKKSPLVVAGWTEAYCRRWCEENDLLSPIYTTSTRGGCWFCHNQGVDQLRRLRHDYPEYWALMLKWDADSPVTFRADGHTVHDFDRRFALEDEGLLRPGDPCFRWEQLDGDLQYSLFLGEQNERKACT